MPSAGEILEAGDVTGTMTSYTPVWSSGGTQPVLGNGSITGTYREIPGFCYVSVVLTMGTTTTFGTGFYRLSLPVTPALNCLIPMYFDDSSLSTRGSGIARIILASATGDNMRVGVGTGTTGGWGATAPFTWATGDVAILEGWFRV